MPFSCRTHPVCRVSPLIYPIFLLVFIYFFCFFSICPCSAKFETALFARKHSHDHSMFLSFNHGEDFAGHSIRLDTVCSTVRLMWKAPNRMRFNSHCCLHGVWWSVGLPTWVEERDTITVLLSQRATAPFRIYTYTLWMDGIWGCTLCIHCIVDRMFTVVHSMACLYTDRKFLVCRRCRCSNDPSEQPSWIIYNGWFWPFLERWYGQYQWIK